MFFVVCMLNVCIGIEMDILFWVVYYILWVYKYKNVIDILGYMIKWIKNNDFF